MPIDQEAHLSQTVESASAPSALHRRRWLLVGLLFAASLINYLDRATLSVALPQISKELFLSPTAKGVLLSAFFWSYALMQVPMGWLTDRFSLRWLYAVCFALWSLACGLTGIVGSFAMLIFLRILLGIGESVYLPGSVRFISRSFSPEDRGLPTGIFDCGTRAGIAVGAPLVALLVERYGWREMFMLVGFVALAWILPWLLVFPLRSGKTKKPAETVPQANARPRRLTINRNLIGACIGFFCFGYYGYLLMTWLPDYLVEVRHLTILKAGVFSAIPFIVWTIAEPTGGWLADRLTRRGWNHTRVRKGMIAIGFSTGLLLIPAALVASVQLTIALISASCLVGFGSSNQLVVFQSCAPPDEVGMWMGTGNFIGNIGGVLSPLITGILISRTHSYFPGFALAPIILIAGILAYCLIVGELKPPAA